VRLRSAQKQLRFQQRPVAGILGIILAITDHRGLGVAEILIREVAAQHQLAQLAERGVVGRRCRAPDQTAQDQARLVALAKLQPGSCGLHCFPVAKIRAQLRRQFGAARNYRLPILVELVQIDALALPGHPACRVLGKSG